jgi:ABC-2 type transport system permease protein
MQTLRILAKDLRLGPRSPMFLFAVVMPVLITLLISAVFGGLFDPSPRLGIVDLGDSVITENARFLDGVAVTVMDDVETLRSRVERHDLDAGLVLPPGIDDALASGARVEIEFYVSGSSLASSRVILAVATLDLISDASDRGPAVEVVLTQVGDADYVPIGDRLVPMMVLYAVVIAGMFLPASSLVEEREQHTLDALLITPARIGDVLAAKTALATLLSVAMAMATLALNRAFTDNAWQLALVLTVGSLMMAELGLLLGLWAKDANTLFTAVKAGGIFIFLPVIFMIWPDLPQWIPRLVPTYYFLQPVFEISVLGGALSDHIGDVLIAAAICVVLLPLVTRYAQHAERRLATTG